MAVQAPSADNHHHWKLRCSADALELALAADLRQMAQTRRLLTLISLGAVAESLCVEATALGWRLLPELDLGNPAVPVRLRLAPGAVEPDPLAGAALRQRHSNRELRFTGPALDVAQQSVLSLGLGVVPGTQLGWHDGKPQRRALLALLRAAETERFANPALHQELFEAVRFDLGWSQGATEGLAPASLGVAPWERPGFSSSRHWGLQKFLNLIGMHKMLGARAADLPCRLAPHVCSIAATGSVEQGAFSAGRALLRVWAAANANGLAVSVYAAAPLYALVGATDVRADLQQRLQAGWRELSPGATPFMVLRLGHAAAPKVRNGRPPAASFLLN
ncbi:hypothetical protein J7U46_01520 [Pelomonas sp. V22]|uniref:hypothetical protein n=1 Tax=Pelomonas sp. V22 TaxID=2822139 RepID=UPI0024A81CF5|nr:hypothetical protein [Pelomonas sp. V22]MDI4631720.1 hypothetical protein [Pelomonas sp. V22]